MEEKKAYQEKYEAKLKEWKARIQLLEAKAEQVKAESKIEYQNMVQELKAKQQAMHGKLDELKASGESAWKEMRSGLEKAKDELKGALDRAVDRFKEQAAFTPQHPHAGQGT